MRERAFTSFAYSFEFGIYRIYRSIYLFHNLYKRLKLQVTQGVKKMRLDYRVVEGRDKALKERGLNCFSSVNYAQARRTGMFSVKTESILH